MQSRRHCPLLRIAPSVVPHGSRVALQFSPIMNKRPIRICGTEDQSLRVRLCWTQEELAKNLWQMGWQIIWKNARRVESASSSRSKPATRAVFARRPFCPHGNAAFRAESGGFDLAADFLYSIVIPVNVMTFQTRDIGNTLRKLAGAPLGGAIDTVASWVCAGIDKHLSSSGDFHVTH
jgi:hypothetical protein